LKGTHWQGAPRSVGAGRERKDKYTSAAILDHDWRRRKGQGDPRRFEAARFAGMIREAGHHDLAHDLERAFGLRRAIVTPACRCYRGLERAPIECPACRHYRMGWTS
jgi:hypothetical protein